MGIFCGFSQSSIAGFGPRFAADRGDGRWHPPGASGVGSDMRARSRSLAPAFLVIPASSMVPLSKTFANKSLPAFPVFRFAVALTSRP
jgi:hypothetical protein